MRRGRHRMTCAPESWRAPTPGVDMTSAHIVPVKVVAHSVRYRMADKLKLAGAAVAALLVLALPLSAGIAVGNMLMQLPPSHALP